MAESVVLEAQARKGQGSRAARRLRKEGKVPAVLYGHGEGTVSVELAADAVELFHRARHCGGSRNQADLTDAASPVAGFRVGFFDEHELQLGHLVRAENTNGFDGVGDEVVPPPDPTASQTGPPGAPI